jgi:uroporphyrinogen decarboxylase
MGVSGVLNSMGLDNFAFALMDDPELPSLLLDMYVDWCIELLRKTQRIGLDVIVFADDVAFNTAPMVSPDVFREVFLPKMKKVAAAMKLPWIYHSDGNLMPILVDLLSLGMDGLHPLEPGAIDIEEVKRAYGKRVCLVGNIDLHYTLTLGSTQEVDREVKKRIEKIGKGGGYILSTSNSIVSYAKTENLLAMRDALVKYRKY